MIYLENTYADFKFVKFLYLNSGFIAIKCNINSLDRICFPIYHDNPINMQEVLCLLDQIDLPCFLALCAPDGSVVIYKTSNVDFSQLNASSDHDKENNDDSDS